eukprot:gene10856-12011_t
MASKPLVAVRNLQRMAYQPAMQYMRSLEQAKLQCISEKHLEEPQDTLLLVEHNPVYTIGRRKTPYLGLSGKETHEIENRLRQIGAEFWTTNRGGLITFHGPGQLVCYPILNLRNYRTSIRWYINSLEEVIIKTCAEFGVFVNRTEDIGVWIEDRKIAAIGVHVSKYITSHGLALNCNTDLNWFNHIVPCGIAGKSVTSLSKELNKEITIDNVLPIFLDNLKKKFNCELILEEDFHKKEIIV